MKKLLLSLAAFLALGANTAYAAKTLYAIQIHNQSADKVVFDGYGNQGFASPNWIHYTAGGVMVLPGQDSQILEGIYSNGSHTAISYRIRLHDNSLDTSNSRGFRNILITLFQREDHRAARYGVGCNFPFDVYSKYPGQCAYQNTTSEQDAAHAYKLDIWVRPDNTFVTKMTGDQQIGHGISDKRSPFIDHEYR